MSDLKPCPFCGGEAELHVEGRLWTVDCIGECETEGFPAKSQAAAIAAWNRRAPDPALTRRVAELEEGLLESAGVLEDIADPAKVEATVSVQHLWARAITSARRARALLTKDNPDV